MALAPEWLMAELVAERYGPCSFQSRTPDVRTGRPAVEYNDTPADFEARRNILNSALDAADPTRTDARQAIGLAPVVPFRRVRRIVSRPERRVS